MAWVELSGARCVCCEEGLSFASLLQQNEPPEVASAVVAASVEGVAYDLCEPCPQGCKVVWIMSDSPEGRGVLRHSCAHLLGHAVKQLWPEAKMAIGPVVEQGFYYDVELSCALQLEDLERFAERMRHLAQSDYRVEKKWVTWEEAVDAFRDRQEVYKLEILEEDIPKTGPVSLYQHQEYLDMCRGPHVPSMRFCQHVALLKVSGAYWRGDQKRPVLQRLYGTAWESASALEAALVRRVQAKQRDHRRLGQVMDLFHLQEEAPGSVFWHPKGWTLFRGLEHFIREQLQHYGYQEVKTPQLISRALWERSGHWAQYAAHMFTLECEAQSFALKPMNCPGHVQIFNKKIRSYRELPLRLSEFGSCHRNEPSGSLHGLMRVRNFTQDDAHIFCTPEQVQQEVRGCLALVQALYKTFGFVRVNIVLSTRPLKRIGEEALWDLAEAGLQTALRDQGLDFKIAPGEGAFYGPKIDLVLKDSLDRDWQCGTIQLDFALPERLGASYVDSDNQRKSPVMIHRALLGSIERFIAILIEDLGGHLPLWLAPEHAVVVPISQKHVTYAQSVEAFFVQAGLRVSSDLRNEKIGFKIREHTLRKVPYLLVCGDSERAQQGVCVRECTGQVVGVFALDALRTCFLNAVEARAARLSL